MDDQNLQEAMDEQGLDEENTNRIEEYFKTKDAIRTFRNDLKELKETHEDAENLKNLSEEVKNLRKKINDTEDIRIISDKISGLKERMDLLKDIIYAELKETDEKEVKMNGRKLKIIEVLKEMKDEESE
ncbi:hypothetical protein JW978_04150 [Candidatus Dojkabacteria bacterium]|nr:hypothetical protein [Candidatus Dojkabacteria bacterium]